MRGVTDEQLTLAKVYANAMIQLTETQAETDLLARELNEFATLVNENAELETFLASPTIDRDTRQTAIEKLFRGEYSDLFVNSIQVLNSKGRSNLVRAVAEAYSLAREERLGRIRVFVRTATPLSEELRISLKGAARRYTGKEAELIESVDASLIGGLVVQVGDEKFDGTVRTRLSRIGSALRECAVREVFGDRVHVEGAPG